ncbi:MAG TPA: aspartate kinase [Clostridia bacterium]|nr:aspartate kinase [Clostridia bacterium]
MGIIVQKFGGTSVATESARLSLLDHVRKARQQGHDVVLVVSAMGRKGEPYATDTISGLLETIGADVDPAKKDLLLSCGEIISCSLIAHYLDTNGIAAEALTGFQAGILTTDDFNNSNIININTTNIHKYINLHKVPVIAGFQGITWDGKITTLGRGGSDTTAVELGGFLKAEAVDIFTDVPGVAFTDPRVYPGSEYISRISYDDMYRLAKYGAKVIHPRAVEAAKKYQLQVRIRSTYSEENGTLISGEPTVSSKKIIGIALDRRSLDITSAYILLNQRFSDIIKKAIAGAISNKCIKALEVIYSENNVAISMENDHIAHNIRAIHDL